MDITESIEQDCELNRRESRIFRISYIIEIIISIVFIISGLGSIMMANQSVYYSDNYFTFGLLYFIAGIVILMRTKQFIVSHGKSKTGLMLFNALIILGILVLIAANSQYSDYSPIVDIGMIVLNIIPILLMILL
jgi:hypothetical protein